MSQNFQGTQIQWLTTSIHRLGVPVFETCPSGVPTKRTVGKWVCAKLDSTWQEHVCSYVLWIHVLWTCSVLKSWLSQPQMVGKPKTVRVFHFRNVWICFDMACRRRWNSWWNMMIWILPLKLTWKFIPEKGFTNIEVGSRGIDRGQWSRPWTNVKGCCVTLLTNKEVFKK